MSNAHKPQVGSLALAYLQAEVEHRIGNPSFALCDQQEGERAHADLESLIADRNALLSALNAMLAASNLVDDKHYEAMEAAESEARAAIAQAQA